jgi:tRNA-intron endonuclease
MRSKEIEATFCGGEVVVPLREDAEMLSKSGYGAQREDSSLVLSSCETLYLTADNRIKVVEEIKKLEVTFEWLLGQFKVKDPEIWARYLVFRDLRSRGYVVKEGVGWGIDFRMYERGKYGEKAAKYVVFTLCEGSPISTDRLNEILRLVQSMKKELIVAVMDRRGEIVYYLLSQLNLNLR